MRRILVLALILAAPVAAAQEGYVGLSFGSFDYEEEASDPILGLVSDTVGQYKLFGGFEIVQYLAIQVDYTKVGGIEDTASFDTLQFGRVDYFLDMDMTITSVAAVGMLPKDWGALIAGIGYYSSELDFREAAILECCDTVTSDGTINDDGLQAMLGIEWRFGRFGARYAIRLEYNWFDMDGTDTSSLGLGFLYGF